jgi:hypothetical protein
MEFIEPFRHRRAIATRSGLALREAGEASLDLVASPRQHSFSARFGDFREQTMLPSGLVELNVVQHIDASLTNRRNDKLGAFHMSEFAGLAPLV